MKITQFRKSFHFYLKKLARSRMSCGGLQTPFPRLGVLAGLLSVIQDVLRGGYKQTVPPCFARHGAFFCPLTEASFVRVHKKAPHFVRDFFVCAQDWIRTSTPFPALPPQGSASTNFATWARGRTNLCKNQDMKKWSGYF